MNALEVGGVGSQGIGWSMPPASRRLSAGHRQAVDQTSSAGGQPSLDEVPFRVISKVGLNPRTVVVRLAPLEAELHFQAGQYVLLTDLQGEVEPRSYSVANAARPGGELDLVVTAVPGGQASQWIHQRLAVGDKVLVSGPYGNFTRDCADVGDTVYLAGGVGLAPILALLEEAFASAESASLHLILSARTEADVICRSRLLECQERHSNFRFIRTLTRAAGEPPLGRLPAQLPQLLGSLAGQSVFAAGPEGFVDECARAIRQLGVPPGRIHTEAFFLEPQPWGGGVG
jgi:CDP-4-dehydro-6-deoxyglucose reductase